MAVSNETCQFGIVKEKYDKNGDLFEFIPVDIKKGTICISTDLNVAIFSTYKWCQPTVWQLEEYDPSMNKIV